MIFDIGGAMYGLGNLAGLVRNGAVPGAVATYLSASIGEVDVQLAAARRLRVLRGSAHCVGGKLACAQHAAGPPHHKVSPSLGI
jgi:hypothetical protein